MTVNAIGKALESPARLGRQQRTNTKIRQKVSAPWQEAPARATPDRRTVADQIGDPTSAELIADITAHAIVKTISNPDLYGLYHLSASGETSWHGFDQTIASQLQALAETVKVAPTAINPISTMDYPAPARRPLSLNVKEPAKALIMWIKRPWTQHYSSISDLSGRGDPQASDSHFQ